MAKFTRKQYSNLYEIASKTTEVLPFINDTPQQRTSRIKKVKGSDWGAFSYFLKTYFPHVFEKEFCRAHRDAFEAVEKNKGGLTGVTGFRGLGKTVEFTIYSLWKIIKGVKYVINTSADVDLAEERSSFIYNELTNNIRLLNDFPEVRISDGTEEDFYLQNKARIRCRSIKQNHRGTINPRTAKRPGLIVCDDIDKEENAGNQTIGKRKMAKIREELVGALSRDEGRVVWLGNLTHPNYAICQFEELIINEIKQEDSDAKPEMRNHLKSGKNILLKFPLEIVKATMTETSKATMTEIEKATMPIIAFGKPKTSIVSAWEEQYPTASLPELRKQLGTVGYQREMLGLKMIEGNIFKNEWFLQWTQISKKISKVWMYADPAWGKKGCFRAITVIVYDGNYFDFTHVWVRQTSNSNFYDAYHRIFTECYNLYGVRFRAAMEANYGQTRHWEEFDRWCDDNVKPKISHRIKKIFSKGDKNLRIEETETSIESGKVRFCKGQDFETLKTQFLTYPQGYIDGPDCAAGNLRLFNEYSGKGKARIRKLKG